MKGTNFNKCLNWQFYDFNQCFISNWYDYSLNKNQIKYSITVTNRVMHDIAAKSKKNLNP